MAPDQRPNLGSADAAHNPVLLAEVLAALAPVAGCHVLDGTFGAGGYSRALLKAGARVTAIDRDPSVLAFAQQLDAEFPKAFAFIAGRFSQMDELVTPPVDAIVLDIGVSSMQLDRDERGFSFLREGPLDMRMGAEGVSAADLVNKLGEEKLAEVLFGFGEERRSRRIAAAIVQARGETPLTTTRELAELIESTVGRRPGEMHPATRTFQALRIAVNGELDELVAGLFAAERLLGPQGRLVVVSFHSLEDRIVKRFFSADKTGPARSRHLPEGQLPEARWEAVAKPVRAGELELGANPRARSATLRHARRTSAPARAPFTKGLGVPGASIEGAL